MTMEVILGLAGFTVLVIVNIVALSSFASKMSNRMSVVEDSIKILFLNDKAHTNEMKTLYEIKGQLELLIKHFTLNK